MFLFLMLFVLKECTSSSVLDEKQCSKFDYEYRVLERIIYLENKNSELEKKQLVAGRKNEELVEIVKEQRLEMERMHQEQENELKNLEEEFRRQEKVDNETTLKHETTLSEAEKSLSNAVDTLRQDMENANNADKAARKEMETKLMSKIETAVKEMTPKSSSVAFTARLSDYPVYNKGDTIKYDSVVTNIGGGYNTSTGVFTAPHPGTYLFSVTIRIYNAKAFVQLMKGEKEVVKIYPFDYDIGHYDSPSMSAVVELAKGDNVFVKFSFGGRKVNYSVHGSKYCTFSGFLFH